MVHWGWIPSLMVLIACHQMLIPKGQGGFCFFPFNCKTQYLICEMFRNSVVSSAFSAWSLPGHETGGVQPILLMAHSCLAQSSCWHPAPPDPSSAMSSTGDGWEHPESLPSPAPAGLSPSPRHTQAGARAEVVRDRDRGQQALAACGHPSLCIALCISKATVTIVSAPPFKNRATVSKQAL